MPTQTFYMYDGSIRETDPWKWYRVGIFYTGLTVCHVGAAETVSVSGTEAAVPSSRLGLKEGQEVEEGDRTN